MRRSIILTALVTSVASTTLTALVMLALLPAVVDAQVERLTAAGLTIARADGLQGVVADVRPTGGGIMQVLGPDGTTPRVQMASGGAAAGQAIQPGPGGAGVNVYDGKGTQVARLGISGGESAIVQIQLADAQGKVRYRTTLDPDGNPSIQLYDADGQVTWSAP
jgi:hypothetical protein